MIEDWHKALYKYIGPRGFTINEHYLTHISYIMNHLGPLRYISARTLERTIGQAKSKIKSRSMPGKNASNFVKARLSESYKS